MAVGHRNDGEALCPVTLVSADGLSWESEDRACGEGALWSVTRADGGFLAAGGVLAITSNGTVQKPLLLRSEDGHAWTAASLTIPGPLSGVAARGNVVILTAADGVYRASNDLTWEKQTLPSRGAIAPRVDHVTWGIGKFFVYADDSAYESEDGRAWEQVRFGDLATYSERGTYPWRLSFANESLFASVVEDGSFGEEPANIHHWMARTSDGRSWQTAEARLFTSIAYGKGLYVGATEGQLFSSTDGRAWSAANASAPELGSVVFTRGAFFAAAEKVILRSEDGRSWTVVYSAP